jgi:hypothetical protein
MVVNQDTNGLKAGTEVVIDAVHDGPLFGSKAVAVSKDGKRHRLWDDKLSPTEDKKGQR